MSEENDVIWIDELEDEGWGSFYLNTLDVVYVCVWISQRMFS